MGPERLQGVVQSPDFVIYCEHEAGAIVVRRSGALAAENEEASSVAAVILHAGLDQSGRTVELSLVVPDRTSGRPARRLGRRFVWLVKTNSQPEVDPARLLGAGVFDYIVRGVTPSNTVLAEGGKNTTDEQLTW